MTKTNLEVNPILDTFDMLHLQEISLRSRKLNRPERMKNTNNRRGGKVLKQKRKRLDKLLKFGCLDQ